MKIEILVNAGHVARGEVVIESMLLVSDIATWKISNFWKQM